ncbi:MAG: glycoside hydrolase family 3 C-terminal domain-containing protein [Lachnospiraceae bacterium]|nr:glycoside hydrolase family 3 C-terminal domain-containing protein [Lachnospiraceae bacterium]
MEKNNSRVLRLIGQMTDEEKLLCLHGQRADAYRGGQAGFVHGIERLGIPDVFICDGESGINTTWDATAFPSKVGLAASFDKQAAYLYGEAMGREAKAMGMHLLLSPRVNIVRDYAAEAEKTNGGNYQTYGEDPVLNGILGAEETKGIQKDGQCIANAKQIYGSSTGSAQGAGNSVIDEQTAREIYLRPFDYLYKAGVGSSMSSYNQVNGEWTYDSKLAHEVLARQEGGFRGPVLCDWMCLYDEDSLRHGVTLEMPGGDDYGGGSEGSVYGKRLLSAAADPDRPVTTDDIDNAVYIYLDTLDRFGMLDEQRIPGPLPEELAAAHTGLAKALAVKTAVLLKNEDAVLPLDPEKERIAVIGPAANRQIMPVFKESAFGFDKRRTGTYQVLDDRYPGQITFAAGGELAGEVIPAEYLYTDPDMTQHGLTRYTGMPGMPFGPVSEAPAPAGALCVDEIICYDGENGLPDIHTPAAAGMNRPAYIWHGYLKAPETGSYRINVETYMPGEKEYEENRCSAADLMILSPGNLYLRRCKEPLFDTVGRGGRIAMNGGAAPNSSVVTAPDGWNIAGGEVILEAGQVYEIWFSQMPLYHTPVRLRLTWRTPSMKRSQIEEAVQAAKNADKAVVFAWQASPNPVLRLADDQDTLISEVAKANPNTVVIINSGDPVEMPWKDSVKAILEMWYPGQEGAEATADIMTGKAVPGGKLPVTFPVSLERTPVRDPDHPERYAEPGKTDGKDAVQPNTAVFSEGIMIGYRWFDENREEVNYPFGHGLSYTSFEYSEPAITPAGGGFDVRCRITNTGTSAGEEVVQLYLGRPEEVPEGIQAAVNQLADFARIQLEPGESQQVCLHLPEILLKSFDAGKGEWRKLTGIRPVRIGSSSRDIRIEENVNIS